MLAEQQRSRVTSFSIKSTDREGTNELAKLTAHSAKTGISISFLILQAIKKLNLELESK
jgi:hypothetical protein